MGYQTFPNGINATVPTGASGTSGAVSLLGNLLYGLLFPSNFVTSDVTIKGGYSPNATAPTCVDMYNTAASTVYKRTAVAASTIWYINPDDFGGCTHIEIISTTTQTADKTVVILTRPAT